MVITYTMEVGVGASASTSALLWVPWGKKDGEPPWIGAEVVFEYASFSACTDDSNGGDWLGDSACAWALRRTVASPTDSDLKNCNVPRRLSLYPQVFDMRFFAELRRKGIHSVTSLRSFIRVQIQVFLSFLSYGGVLKICNNYPFWIICFG